MEREVLMKTHAGSFNYNLMTEDSDIDYKVYVAPTVDDLFFGKMYSKNSKKIDGDYDYHDIRRLSELLRKSNLNFIEGLFSEKIYLTGNLKIEHHLKDLLALKEDIARMNLMYLFNACVGMSYNKQKKAEKITLSNPGQSNKDIMTAYRVLDFLERYYLLGFNEFGRAIRYNNSERDKILNLRKDVRNLEKLENKRGKVFLLKDNYNVAFDEDTFIKLNNILKNIMLLCIK